MFSTNVNISLEDCNSYLKPNVFQTNYFDFLEMIKIHSNLTIKRNYLLIFSDKNTYIPNI